MKKKHGFSALLARFRATLSGNTQLLVGLILVFIMVALAILAPVPLCAHPRNHEGARYARRQRRADALAGH